MRVTGTAPQIQSLDGSVPIMASYVTRTLIYWQRAEQPQGRFLLPNPLAKALQSGT